MSEHTTTPSPVGARNEEGVLPSGGTLLAIDWGEKRIGLALSDAEQHIAHPLGTLTRRLGRRFPMKQLRVHLDAHQPVGVLVGLPLEESGEEGPNAEKARLTGELVRSKSGIPVSFFDERMTTARALQAVRDLGGNTRGRREEIDSLAATVLLQTYLDTNRS